ncbi:MAG TPA: aminotransferase class I/II-fold pyridoxal phosphate-dependent enzyme [Ktedonobacterales bacterium]|jgi:glycine hydroxymethyltransferase|nr:aminotransferase class I/II-fold pyridoxal phosphate-dependent enzyme [Ktedonobacterales bacterium]
MGERDLRPWLTETEATRVEQLVNLFDSLSPGLGAEQVAAYARRSDKHYDNESVVLYAGTNVMDPRASALMGGGLSSRPSLGHPGAKYETGLEDAEAIEMACLAFARNVFGAPFIEYRVASGSLANLYAFMALAKPGDTLLALPTSAAGHATHRETGAAGLYGLRIVDIPWNAEQMEVDVEGLAEVARRERPRIILLGGSLVLFPYPVREARAIADEVGASLMYDAAHVSALITTQARPQFQSPLDEGAHVVTFSTYKSLGGPSGGMLLTNDAEIAERIERIAYPGLTANFDDGRVAALAVSLAGFSAYGVGYVTAMLENGRTLARALAEHGLPVVAAPHGFTTTHHVALDALPFGGGDHAARRLARCAIHSSGIGLPGDQIPGDYNGVRFGVQEVTRWGMGPNEMHIIAGLVADRLLDRRPVDAIWRDVRALRRDFQRLRFVLP